MTKFFLSALLVAFFWHSASSKEKENFGANVEKGKIIRITTASSRMTFRLSHDVVGFVVNCNRTRLIAWGVPNTASNESPQAEKVSVIDLKKGRRIGSISLGRGIFSASYLKDGISAYIESGYGAALISEYGRLEYLEPNADLNPELEKCPMFKGKIYSKWINNIAPSSTQRRN